MKNHKLILSLKSLSKKELNSFVRMVNTPYFNRRKEVILLIQYLKKHYPDFSEKLVKKEKIFKVISKEKDYNSRVLDDALYQTNKLLEQFLVNETLQNDQDLFAKALMESYKNRNLKEFSLKAIDKYQKQNDSSYHSFNKAYFNYDFELNKYLMEDLAFKENSVDSLYNASAALDLHYWLVKLFINDELNNRKEVLSSIENVLDLKDLKSLEDLLLKNENPLLKVLYFLNFPDEKYGFDEIKTLYKGNIDSIEHQLSRKLLNGLINHCKKMYAKSQDAKYIKEWYELYKIGVETKILFTNNHLNDTTYLNIVHLGIVQKDYDWIAKFIKEAKHYVNDAELYQLSMGMYLYAVKKYEEALSALLEVNFGHIHQNLTARSLIAKIYYESKQFDVLENHLNAYEIYLRRQKEISGQLQEVNINFVLACKKLVKANFDSKAKASLEKDLKEKPIAYKSWFFEVL